MKDLRHGCMRTIDGVRQGWCGIEHRYYDRAKTHARVLNRQWQGVSVWSPVPIDVAKGRSPSGARVDVG